MTQIKTILGQSVWDVAIQGMGSIEGLFGMLRDNEMTMEDPAFGTVVEIRDPGGWTRQEYKGAIVEEIRSLRIKILTAKPSNISSGVDAGFDYELNFEIVS